VVEADPAELVSNYLGGALADNFVVGDLELKQPLLLIGRVEKVNVKIHDLITPFDAGASNTSNGNDGIFIENLFPNNKVSLMDRWGVVIKEWKNYRNHSDDSFFQTLRPGNYICVIEYTDVTGEKKNESQMVTVLKTN
jgi:hypothetical protein